MAFTLNVPETLPFVPKKRFIKAIPNSILVAIPVVATVAYLAHKKGYIDIPFLDKEPELGPDALGMIGSRAANITLSVFPPVVRPDSTITVTGEFQGPGGTPILVNEGHYAVYEEINELGKGIRNKVDGGSLGQNISVYNKVISTRNYRDGTYSIVVADEPIVGDVGDASSLFNQGVRGTFSEPPVNATATNPFYQPENRFDITIS